ncbi:2'-5' RNA ligase [Clostridium botulinum]|uniref:2'-5' RNA ligase n=1 Tax=Clostridium botulinum C/D str. DC5 TaxID=1443128 RepID=A0A0A0I904_CLOBO|nr:hypothetical protein [Clostridium botulinum]KEI01933.1 2'-5' RNA ligase [Clostridium botulinum C/D str. BKT75002]KEI10035.1 2'-5' RNA ligase [Clostridium botulinum C/D str. BKT2873]KGM97352.1 2'-5' RNA ligase [Clostridium botulinum C/D str. DC5]KGM98210.1 2'-5' RNA ligase [Clostridium botulinum D str. CCUG 7971]KOC50419.1 2'-5' RNA ligase [Clostridium botulinum]
MKYHLVALFNDESNKFIETTQKRLCKKYKLYKTNHQFYIHIQTIINPDMDKLNKIVTDTLSPYKHFKVQIDPNFHLDKSLKTVNLKIDQKGYITRIIRNISDTLQLSGFNIQSNSNKNLFISLANSNYSMRKSMTGETPTVLSYKNNVNYSYVKVNRFELWKPINNKKEILMLDYPLRTF